MDLVLETEFLLPLINPSLDRNCRPYISNGVQCQFVDSFVEVVPHQPTVVRAFKLDSNKSTDFEDQNSQNQSHFVTCPVLSFG